MAERGAPIDHSTLNRWVIRYSPQFALEAQQRKRPVSSSWRMDETYIKVKGQWVYLYRAVDKFGNIIDFKLSEQRDEAAATAFFKQAIDHHGLPEKVVIDKSANNNAGLEDINLLFFSRVFCVLSISFRSSILIMALSKTIGLSKKSPDPCWGLWGLSLSFGQ